MCGCDICHEELAAQTVQHQFCRTRHPACLLAPVERTLAVCVFPSPILHPSPWVSGNAYQADKSLSAQTSDFFEEQKGPASPLRPRRQGGSRFPHPGTGRRCLSPSTSSKPQVYCGAVAFSTHPALLLSTQAGSLSESSGLGESHGSARCLQGSKPFLLLGLRIGASPLSFPLRSHAPCSLRWISLLGGATVMWDRWLRGL